MQTKTRTAIVTSVAFVFGWLCNQLAERVVGMEGGSDSSEVVETVPLYSFCNEDVRAIVQGVEKKHGISAEMHHFTSGAPLTDVFSGWVEFRPNGMLRSKFYPVVDTVTASCYPRGRGSFPRYSTSTTNLVLSIIDAGENTALFLKDDEILVIFGADSILSRLSMSDEVGGLGQP